MNYTIAIPVYNGARTLGAAIASARDQNAPFPFEVLVVDNASTDSTPEIIQTFTGRVRVLRNPSMVTMYENHNVCLREAAGRHVLFCHADDVLEPHALTTVDRALCTVPTPERTVLWGRSLFRDFARMLEISGYALDEVFSGPSAVKPFLYYGVSPSGTCYPRETMNAVGGFVYTAHPLCPNDWMTMILLANREFSFVMIDQLYMRRKFSSTLPDNTPLARRMEAGEAAIRDLRLVLRDDDILATLKASFDLKVPPTAFYYACAKNRLSRPGIKRHLLLKGLRYPLLWKDPLAIRTLLA
ncbi:MAG TPA: glycosyltransferase family A protein [Kiritimatiellia bacterium]|nr:glycosyltransferase family A protein [Kiritimatiellia bacterium]HMO99317.1 glycosyltransferase family A protein [Kiritimatiellia bacterium]HMP96075.1 glycosyltransferase family A protein [Kiritimatiellia bacterium]